MLDLLHKGKTPEEIEELEKLIKEVESNPNVVLNIIEFRINGNPVSPVFEEVKEPVKKPVTEETLKPIIETVTSVEEITNILTLIEE